MVILGLETATRPGSVALLADGQRFATAGTSDRTHSERLPAELLEFASVHGRDLRGIDYLAVVTGPGSFTGLRIGLAAVQGVSMVCGTPVIPVPTLEALVTTWRDAHRLETARVVTCLDGARGDVFVSVVEAVADERECRVLLEPFVAAPVEAAARIAALAAGSPIVIIGDGLKRHRQAFENAVPSATFDDSPWNLALGAVLLAADRTDRAVPPHALRPLYVRRPDAVLARERSRVGARAAGIAQEGALTFARARTAEDLAAVADLQRRSFANAWAAEAIRWELDNSAVARLYTARYGSGPIVAYCACWILFDELHINSFAVDTPRRREGVATALLAHVLREAVTEGVRGATLEVRQSNRAARALYEGLGFKVEGIRRNYYQNPREDALILWLRDLGGPLAEAERT